MEICTGLFDRLQSGNCAIAAMEVDERNKSGLYLGKTGFMRWEIKKI